MEGGFAFDLHSGQMLGITAILTRHYPAAGTEFLVALNQIQAGGPFAQRRQIYDGNTISITTKK